jgi:membrane associated rhomboid family serine protease/Zn-finger nucleic acid-binding protein
LKTRYFPNLVPVRKVGNLKCPDCQVLMTPYSCQNVVIDRCSACDGIWFDHLEFGVFKRTLDAHDLSKIESIEKPVVADAICISECPKCREPLVDINYSYNSGVKINKCVKCRGLWLPIHQTLNLIELAKISQAIGPDLKGLAKESEAHHEEVKRAKAIGKMGKQLNQSVPWWSYGWMQYLPVILPLYDENPRIAFPFSTVGLIVINAVIFLWMSFGDMQMTQIYDTYALQAAEAFKFQSLHTFLTSMFIHAGVLHFLGNMFFLWTFGDNVEEKLGTSKYLLFFLMTGVVAGIAQTSVSPDSMLPILGASGAISGIMGAYIVLFPHVNIKTLFLGYIVDLPTWCYLGLWFALQLLWAAVDSGSEAGGVGWFAHIGGFACGFVLAKLLSRQVNRPKSA